MKKLTIRDLNLKKQNKDKVTFITAYDYQMGRLAEESGVDLILVGDSVGNNVLGYKDTRPVTMEEMITFSKAVRRGAPNTFVIGDMPLGSYQVSDEEAIYNALRFIKEAEMDAVKCEGGERVVDRVKAMTDAGISVMGHIGYTPQSTNVEGIVQGKNVDSFMRVLNDAYYLQSNGAFAILLEAMPNESSRGIANKLNIPIYGIGAGRDIDGVLSIMHDVIGLGKFKSKFVKNYCDTNKIIGDAIKEYISEVKEGKYPSEDYFYKIKSEEVDKIKNV